MIEDNEFYWKLLDTMKDGVYFANQDRKITYWNKAAEDLTGYRSGEVLGKFCGDNILIHIDEQGNNLCKGECPLLKVLKSGEPVAANIFLHHKEGHRLPVFVRVNPVKNKQGQVIGAVEIFCDRSLKELLGQRLQKLQHRGLLDPLSRLPNQRYLQMILETRISELRQYDWSFGIIYFHIHIGQQENMTKPIAEQNFASALETVARTLAGSVNPFDVIGRWEREGFLGIFPYVDKVELHNLEKLFQVLVNKTDLSGFHVSLTLSTAAVLAETGDTPVSIIQKAKQSLKF